MKSNVFWAEISRRPVYELHGVTTQDILLCIVTVVRTSKSYKSHQDYYVCLTRNFITKRTLKIKV
jgi:hypothetical protein